MSESRRQHIQTDGIVTDERSKPWPMIRKLTRGRLRDAKPRISSMQLASADGHVRLNRGSKQMREPTREPEFVVAREAADRLAVLIEQYIARHGDGFLQAVAEDVDRLTAAARLWGAQPDDRGLKELRAALKHSESASTKRGKELQKFIAYHRAMVFLRERPGWNTPWRGLPRQRWEAPPSTHEYAEIISAKLDAQKVDAPRALPPPPPPRRKKGTTSNV